MNKSCVVFSAFPYDSFLYQEDVQGIVLETLKNHGFEEWRHVVVTSEMHGHLGIYAIIGVKMGLYAKEYLRAGLDEIQVISNAGSKPPLSCLNDGLQVSTGATLGHGLFSLGNGVHFSPSADFIYEDKKVTIQLKAEYHDQIDADVNKAFKKNDGLTENYWLEIRSLALKYWQEFNRSQIFQVLHQESGQK